MARQKNSWGQFIKNLLYYHTVKVVQIRSWKLGVLYYFIVAVVLFYVGFYAIYWQRGYQSTEELIGNTAVKVKGAAYHNNTEKGTIQVWDAADVVYPPKEPDALFITTNFLQTKKQSRGTCNTRNAKCTTNLDCGALGSQIDDRTGISLGQCNTTAQQCLMYAWCQPEQSDTPQNFLVNIENFTVFVRVTVKFPKFNVTKTNYNNETNDDNLYTVNRMLAGSNYDAVREDGGAIAVIIDWDCNLDNDHCKTTYDFIRIDSQSDDEESAGYNFRYAHYYYLNDPNTGNLTEYRDLYKVYGLRFVFLLSGQARKFDIVPLIINIGSGLALLSVATFVSDSITLFILPDRKFYNRVKYETVETPDERMKRKLDKQRSRAANDNRSRDDRDDFDEENGSFRSMGSITSEDSRAEDQPLLATVNFR